MAEEAGLNVQYTPAYSPYRCIQDNIYSVQLCDANLVRHKESPIMMPSLNTHSTKHNSRMVAEEDILNVLVFWSRLDIVY